MNVERQTLKPMTRFLIHFHRILGTILSVMFLVWFLSGFVMMYHSFPNIGKKEYVHLTSLPDSLPDIQVIRKTVPKTESIRSLTVQMFRRKPVFRVETKNKSYLLSADTLLNPMNESVPYAELEAYARRWNKAPISRVDTLRTLDQWIPTGEYKKDLPVYKFRFADKDNTYLYISSVTGKAVQCVTREQRVWAWLGPIPHFLYFWQLRQHRGKWVTLVSWLAGIGSLMCLAGMVLGVRSYLIAYRKKKRFKTPYKKFYFKWHHVLGFFFGFFVFMFVLSGMMSFNDLPQWMVKTRDEGIAKKLRKSSDINLAAFQADYRLLLQQNPGKIKEITFEQFGNKPFYSVILNTETGNFDASQPKPKLLYLSEADVLERLLSVSDAPKTISLMTEFDNYYVGFTKRMELPVYKVVADDADKSVFYVNPNTGRTRYFNKNLRAGKWIYPAFHSLRFKFFAEHRLLRDIVLWILLLGGTAVSFTGVVLGVKYVGRLMRRRKCRK